MSEGEIMQESKTTIQPPNMTRRSFLKAALHSPLVLLAQPETTKPDHTLLSIETPEARYFPIYELHPFPVSGEELKRVLPPQDIFFYEFNWNARYFVDQSPQAILDSNFPLPDNNTTRPNSARNYYVPKDHLEWLRASNTKICFEGYSFPQADALTSVSIMAGELIVGSNALARILLHVKAKENRGTEEK